MLNIAENVLEDELRQLIAEILEVEPQAITMEANFVDELGMDSMTALEIMASIEKKYKIRIPEEDLKNITNLRQTLDIARTIIQKTYQ
jgi:acyl carrier protein